MKNKVLNKIAVYIPALLIIYSGINKFFPNEALIKGFTDLGVVEYLPLLGIMEIVFAILFIIPKTMRLGFILASCYFAGAIATELSHNVLKINPFIPILLLWIGTFIKDRNIFFPNVSNKNA